MKRILIALLASAAAIVSAREAAAGKIEHVLLISVDGMHASDLARFAAKNTQSTLAELSTHGVTYENALVPIPSDSFPGLLAQLTGGNPRTTGVWYDDAFVRDYASAKDCKVGETAKGAEYEYAGNINVDEKDINSPIDPKKLLADPKNNCVPVYPHSLVRVNNVFDVAKAAGLRTAWSDKHMAYDLVQGPTGKAVDELFTPEIDSSDTTDSVDKTIAYEARKVDFIVNQIKGLDRAGASKVNVPGILGMNFQAISVAQKLKGAGYLGADGEPSPGLAKALEATDKAIGRMTAALAAEKLADNTLVIVSAKHGQSPIDPEKRRIVDSKALKSALGDLAAHVTTDSVAVIWLKDHAKAADAAAALNAKKDELAIDKIWSGSELVANFGVPLADGRVPDIIVQPSAGVIYTKPTATKIAEHGGGTMDDRHVALLVSNPALAKANVADNVSTTQIAPTILRALNLDPQKLDAVRAEKTQPLPGLDALQR